MWQKILVAIDSSPTAKISFKSALSLAKSTGGTLIILHVLSMDELDAPPPPTFTGQYTRNRTTGEYYTKEAVIEKRKKQWQAFEQKRFETLQVMENQAIKQNVNTEIIQISGNPGPTICEQARSLKVDLIIMGNRGISALEKIVLGSVSSYVVQNAFCSVLIARIPNTEAIKIKWQKILVAVDSSPIAQIVFEVALSLAKSTGGILKLLQVLSMDDFKALKDMKNENLVAMKDGGLEPINEALELIKNETLKAIQDSDLTAMKNQALEQDVNTEIDRVLGSPGRTICEQAELSEFDLIVIGNRGLSGLKKIILGSVSNYVINHTSSSVLVARAATE